MEKLAIVVKVVGSGGYTRHGSDEDNGNKSNGNGGDGDGLDGGG